MATKSFGINVCRYTDGQIPYILTTHINSIFIKSIIITRQLYILFFLAIYSHQLELCMSIIVPYWIFYATNNACFSWVKVHLEEMNIQRQEHGLVLPFIPFIFILIHSLIKRKRFGRNTNEVDTKKKEINYIKNYGHKI